MNVLLASLQIAASLLVPVGILWAEPRSRVVRAVSPVILCYGVGMLFGNQPWVDFADPVSLNLCTATVALAIPLLLYAVDLRAWLRLARGTVISYVLCMLAVMVSGAVAHLLWAGDLADSEKLAGMLVGVYTGGTPNMAAIGTGLGVPSETFILLNAADIFVSFAYLAFILALAPRLLTRLVPPTPRLADDARDGDDPAAARTASLPPLRDAAAALALTVVLVALGGSLFLVAPESSRDALVILAITTLGVLASFHPRVRALRGTQDMGQYLLLVFCVAMGFTTDFGKLFGSDSGVFLFTGVVLGGAVLVHFVLAVLCRIDRDTIIITSAAAIFGPHMVGPVAMNLKNRDVIFSGLASGLVGYAVGNYLGMTLAWLLG